MPLPSLCRLRDISLRPEGVFPSRGGSGVAESPASSPLHCEEISLPKAPLPGELAGVSPTERLYSDGPSREPQEAPPLGATATTAACGGNREELLGQRPARRECRNPALLNEVKLRGRGRSQQSPHIMIPSPLTTNRMMQSFLCFCINKPTNYKSSNKETPL